MSGTWLVGAQSGSQRDLVALRPELAALIAEFDAQALSGVGERMRSLMAARVAQLIGADDTSDPSIAEQARNWPKHPDVTDTERAVLDVTESFVIDIHSVTDEQVQRVQALLGDEGVMSVLMNLAILDGFAKFRRVFAGSAS